MLGSTRWLRERWKEKQKKKKKKNEQGDFSSSESDQRRFVKRLRSSCRLENDLTSKYVERLGEQTTREAEELPSLKVAASENPKKEEKREASK